MNELRALVDSQPGDQSTYREAYSWIFRPRREHDKSIRHLPVVRLCPFEKLYVFLDKFGDFDGLTIEKKVSGEKIGFLVFLILFFF